jgi:large subunit ribosomal protein L25
MSVKFTVNAKLRDGRGKNDTGRLRRAGKVPMVVYGKGGESFAVVAELVDVAAIIRSAEGAKTVFAIAIEGGETSNVTFQDRQVDVITGRLNHADLVRV